MGGIVAVGDCGVASFMPWQELKTFVRVVETEEH